MLIEYITGHHCPRTAGVHRFQYSDSAVGIEVEVLFTGAGIDRVRICRVYDQRANRQSRLEIAQRFPVEATVRGLPNAALGAADVNRIVVVGMDGDRGNAPSITIKSWPRADQGPMLRRIRNRGGAHVGEHLRHRPHPASLLKRAHASAVWNVPVRKRPDSVEPPFVNCGLIEILRMVRTWRGLTLNLAVCHSGRFFRIRLPFPISLHLCPTPDNIRGHWPDIEDHPASDTSNQRRDCKERYKVKGFTLLVPEWHGQPHISGYALPK